MSLSVRIASVVIRAYQLLLSPFAGGACRFEPSCSAYAMDAVRAHGAARGLWLALGRVSRCHPLGGHGFDPVPPRAETTAHHAPPRSVV